MDTRELMRGTGHPLRGTAADRGRAAVAADGRLDEQEEADLAEAIARSLRLDEPEEEPHGAAAHGPLVVVNVVVAPAAATAPPPAAPAPALPPAHPVPAPVPPVPVPAIHTFATAASIVAALPAPPHGSERRWYAVWVAGPERPGVYTGIDADVHTILCGPDGPGFGRLRWHREASFGAAVASYRRGAARHRVQPLPDLVVYG